MGRSVAVWRARMSNIETDSGKLPKAWEDTSDTEKGGAAQSPPLKCSAPASPCSFQRSESSAIDTLWSSQWGGELEKEEDGGERHIQTGGNVRGRRGEGYLGKEKWGVNGPTWVASSVDVFPFWVTRPSSLRSRWHNTEDADWNLNLEAVWGSQSLNYPPHHPSIHLHKGIVFVSTLGGTHTHG